MGQHFLYKSVRSASIYTGDEIGGSGIIKQIAYYPTSSKSDSRKIKIYMKEVDYSTFQQLKQLMQLQQMQHWY